MTRSDSKIKQLTILAMLCALAYAAMVFIKIPVVMFLKYEPKDVIILLGGFLYGPLSAFAISAVVSLVEMVTVSDTGILGCVMNIVSTCSFVCTASFIYSRNKTLTGAIVGLSVGIVVMIAVTSLGNYFLVPIYMANERMSEDEAREFVVANLVPMFIPFNLLKGGLNAALTMLLFKPLTTALYKAKLIPPAIVGTRSTAPKWIFIAIATCIAAGLFFYLTR